MTVCSFIIKRRGPLFVLTGSAVLLTFLIGCLQTSAQFSRNQVVNRAFRRGEAPPEFNYYYAGPESSPHAIMGVDPIYTVRSTFWVAFQPEPEKLKKMSANIYGQERSEPNGFNILSHDGVIIGIWFSSLHFPRVMVDQENRTIMVPFSSPGIYNLR